MGDGPRIEVLELTRQEFGHDFESGTAPIEYLRSYLNDLGACSFIREANYVDRHFLDDFARYYARSFHVPDAHCRRLHYFDLSAQALEAQLHKFYVAATKHARTEAESALGEHYLGFVVRRPLKAARIGRSVLRTYPHDDGRLFTVLRPYQVHVGALRLGLQGLAYQQQDVGAAVCASTALWCALQKVAHLAGHRTPTPSTVTQAAQSPYAASYGLTDPQMATALVTLGYAADTFAPEDRRLFRAILAASLRSHLPVILMVGGEHEGHAVTCTGYREPEKPCEVPPTDDEDSTILMRTGAIRTVYVHDDNLGCHAHYELRDEPPEELKGSCYEYGDPDSILWLVRGRAEEENPDWWSPDCLPILSALVPKPSKVRMPVNRLIHLAWSLRHTAELVFDGLLLTYDVAFTTGVEYRRHLLGQNLDRSRMRQFDVETDLPRHIAVVGVWSEDDHLCDFVVSATAIDLAPDEDSLLAAVGVGVPLKSHAWKRLLTTCNEAGVPVIGMSPSKVP